MRQRTPRMRTASTNGPIFPPRYLGAPTMVDALVKDEDEDVDKDAAEAHPVSLPDMDTPSCQSRQLGYQGVHGTSGRRRRILCSTTPGTTYPAPPVLEPHEEVCELEYVLFLWFRHPRWTYQPDMPAIFEEAGPRHLLQTGRMRSITSTRGTTVQ